MKPESCHDCGACCMHMGTPPFIGDEWLNVPHDLRVPLLKYTYTMPPRKAASGPESPCAWLDMTTGGCRHYEYRPSICRDFDRGSDSCLSHRERVGITVGGVPVFTEPLDESMEKYL